MRDQLLTTGNIGGLVTGIIASAEIGNTIYLIVGIISFLVSITCGIVKLYFTIKKAKADGVITPEEAQEIIDQANEILKKQKEDEKK